MVGLHRTFSDPQCASPSASPVVEDDLRLAPAQAQRGQDYMAGQPIWPGQALFDPASQGYPAPQVYSNFNSPYSYNSYNPSAPAPGLGLNFLDFVPAPQNIFPSLPAADMYVAPPATHYGGPDTVPTPLVTGSGGGAGPAPLGFSPSFMNLLNGCGLADTQAVCTNSGDFADSQPACINPSELGGVPLVDDFQALLSYDAPWLDAPAAEDSVPDEPELEVFGVTAYDQEEPGLDSEPEDTLVPSPASVRNTSPLPDGIKGTTTVKDNKRGKKRPSASGDLKRTSKRRRSASSSSSVKDDDEFVDVSSEPEAEDDEEYRPATSRAGRPIRGVRRVSAKRSSLVVSDDETEEQARGRTCSDCGQKFARAAERVRHEQASTCKTKNKNQCPVCHSRITPRNDALRRHQLRTKKCIVIQDSMSRAQLDALGCVTLEEREKDAKTQGALKQAGLKKPRARSSRLA